MRKAIRDLVQFNTDRRLSLLNVASNLPLHIDQTKGMGGSHSFTNRISLEISIHGPSKNVKKIAVSSVSLRAATEMLFNLTAFPSQPKNIQRIWLQSLAFTGFQVHLTNSIINSPGN